MLLNIGPKYNYSQPGTPKTPNLWLFRGSIKKSKLDTKMGAVVYRWTTFKSGLFDCTKGPI